MAHEDMAAHKEIHMVVYLEIWWRMEIWQIIRRYIWWFIWRDGGGL